MYNAGTSVVVWLREGHTLNEKPKEPKPVQEKVSLEPKPVQEKPKELKPIQEKMSLDDWI